MTRKAGKPSPYSSPDYTPPADAPEAFKRIVTHMKTHDDCRTLDALSKRTGISYDTLKRYTNECAGKSELSAAMLEKIEQAAKKL